MGTTNEGSREKGLQEDRISDRYCTRCMQERRSRRNLDLRSPLFINRRGWAKAAQNKAGAREARLMRHVTWFYR